MTTVKVTSEEKLGFEPVPPHQCKDIDYIVEAIRTCEKALKKYERMEEDELRSACSDIDYELNGLERRVEDVRKACEGLREWGQSWKDLCKKIASDNDLKLEDYA